ncbi:MAG TPA: farnesyl diphosphate synthase [Thermoanaerobaculia bacterium]|jgi:geranylgeranyl pyrophosphate synthase|nr:farnesyl diphosphate synthase [Thermoanaerobaculia bacterium]
MTAGAEAAASGVSEYLARRRAEVDAALERLLPGPGVWPEQLHAAIRHSVFAGGKRLRPTLCIAAAEVLGAPVSLVLEPACGLEMIHTYSLIHDDLPALDDDDLRRGVPTCHVVFGEATAILAGDSLLTHGLGVFAAYPRGERYAVAKVRVLETVVDAIGTQGMIGGQAADLEAEEEASPTAELLEKIHENKTGRLIRASLLAGAILVGADEETLARIDLYGRRIGLAFQIKDDLLDVEADAATLGKAAHKDAAAGKATFPVVWGVEKSRALLAENVAEAVATASALPGGGGVLPDLARFVGSRKS